MAIFASIFNVLFEGILDRTAWLKYRVDAAGVELTSLDSRMHAAEDDIDDVEALALSNDGRLDTAEAELVAHAAAIPADVQALTAAGNWTRPANAKLMHVTIQAEGGQGGTSGAGGSGAVRAGGGSGGAGGERGGFIEFWLRASDYPAATYPATFGASSTSIFGVTAFKGRTGQTGNAGGSASAGASTPGTGGAGGGGAGGYNVSLGQTGSGGGGAAHGSTNGGAAGIPVGSDIAGSAGYAGAAMRGGAGGGGADRTDPATDAGSHLHRAGFIGSSANGGKGGNGGRNVSGGAGSGGGGGGGGAHGLKYGTYPTGTQSVAAGWGTSGGGGGWGWGGDGWGAGGGGAGGGEGRNAGGGASSPGDPGKGAIVIVRTWVDLP